MVSIGSDGAIQGQARAGTDAFLTAAITAQSLLRGLMVCTDEEAVAAPVQGSWSETDRRVYETEQFPGRRACKARTEMDDGFGVIGANGR